VVSITLTSISNFSSLVNLAIILISSLFKEVFPYTVKDFNESLFLKSIMSCLLLAINFLKFLRFFKEDAFKSGE